MSDTIWILTITDENGVHTSPHRSSFEAREAFFTNYDPERTFTGPWSGAIFEGVEVRLEEHMLPDPDPALSLDTMITAEEFRRLITPIVDQEANYTEEQSEYRTLADYLANLSHSCQRFLAGEMTFRAQGLTEVRRDIESDEEEGRPS